MGKNLFISDLHLGHANVLAFDNRPFKNIEEHDDMIVKRWNSKVELDDTVWILGDVSFMNATKTCEILEKLNGAKNLIIGNHDKKLLKNADFRSFFNTIKDYHEIVDDDGKSGIILSHYPIPCFNHHYYGWKHFYGHVHNSFEENIMQRVRFEMGDLYSKPCNMYNVGAMMPYINYVPRTEQEIIDGYNKFGSSTRSG